MLRVRKTYSLTGFLREGEEHVLGSSMALKSSCQKCREEGQHVCKTVMSIGSLDYAIIRTDRALRSF